MTQRIDIDLLNALSCSPKSIAGAYGDYYLVGIYIAARYWLSTINAFGRGLAVELKMAKELEAWIDICDNYLPDWAKGAF